MNDFISKRENQSAEFKKSVGEWKEIVETISAFSNTRGGEILVGMLNSGKVIGVKVGKDTIEDLTNKIVSNTDPKVYPKISVEKVKGKCIIVIEVKESAEKLVLAFGRPFKRVGKSTVRMSKDEYERSILEKHKDKLQFDKQICEEATLKDFDWNYIKEKFVPLYEKLSEKKITGNLQSLLKSLGCIREGEPTNAGILLFGKEPQKFYMNAYIALARYRGEEVETKRLDYKEFTGNLF
jgi:ATP-dependent DNA helicase RecG